LHRLPKFMCRNTCTMKQLRTLLAENKFFFTFTLFVFISAIFFLLLHTKEGSFLLCNPWHPVALDRFFTVFTNLGDGLFSLLIVLILMVRKKITTASLIFAAYLFSGLLAQIAKNIYHAPRPATLFVSGSYRYFIQGITHVGYSSFPSGHTASAFALATIFAILDPGKYRGIIYLLAACAIGYSRIYLGQHFPADVFGGALLGFFSAVLVYLVFMRLKNRNIKPAYSRMHDWQID